MMGDELGGMRLMNFVSEEQLDEAKKSRGERVEDGTAQRDRPLFEILKENKDKKDAEFNERFKHRPPKALDEEETEFLHHVESSRKEYERQIADEEAQQLRSFQAAVAAQSMTPTEDLPQTSNTSTTLLQDDNKRVVVGKKTQPPLGSGFTIKVKQPQPKKPRLDNHQQTTNLTPNAALVSYSDDSDDDD